MRALREDTDCAGQEAERDLGTEFGLYATAHVPARVRAPGSRRPGATLVRDQGSNGHVEMAAALDSAGFNVHTTTLAQLAAGKAQLDGTLLVLPGGFTHGDVLGAGVGQAQAILHHHILRTIFTEFFHATTLTLGVCNGCQVLSRLGELLPNPVTLPTFQPNRSRRFECRLAQVEVLPSPSPFLGPLAGIRLPVPVACGEGQTAPVNSMARNGTVPVLRYLGPDGQPASCHPHDPCGSVDALCGYTTTDGKLTFLMPHPERAVRPAQLSWCPPAWRTGTTTPWHDFFVHARNHLAQQGT